MGGKAAKERRRQQREQLQVQQGSSSPVVNKNRPKGRPPTANRKFAQRESFPKKTQAGKVIKVKKPKHLKRKLETIDDDEEKKRLLIALEEWDETKAKHSKQPNKKRKFQSPESNVLKEEHTKKGTTSTSATPHAATSDKKSKPVTPKALVNNQQLNINIKQPQSRAEQPVKFKKVESVPPHTSSTETTKKSKPKNKKQTDSETSENANVSANLLTEPVPSAPSDTKETDARHKNDVIARKNDDDSDDSSESEDDSSVDDVAETTRRQRGKRRRGRQDTEKHIRATLDETEERKEPQTSFTAQGMSDDAFAADWESKEPMNPNETAEDRLERKKRDKKEYDKRYCVGRKPVTDFVIGQRCRGKVVYAKPFGIFIDIGCHSDAFCHVSRLRDDFVDSATDAFQEGDAVDARVVEIDRKQKRITVSLQSDARIEDERKSIEARQERRAKHTSKKRKISKAGENVSRDNGGEFIQDSPQPSVASAMSKPIPPAATKPISQETFGKPSQSTFAKPSASADLTSPAELKRARKLARRAARRAVNEESS